jgi:seryl-tRNA synthetase
MLDIKEIRKDAAAVEARLKGRDPTISLKHVATLDERLREVTHEVEELKAARNQMSKQIGDLKRKGEDTASIMDEVATFGERIKVLDHERKTMEEELHTGLAALPNLPDEDLKISERPEDNVEVHAFGSRPSFAFEPKNHVELNERLGLFDFKRGAKISGTGWPVYRGMGARLEWALLQYMVAIQVKNGFDQWMVPHCVRPETMYGVGQFPKFADQVYRVEDNEHPLYLIPTSEAAICGLFGDEILPAEELPMKLFSYTPCFRKEGVAAGAQERGLIRVHQFNKVEMFCFVRPEESDAVFEQMVASADEVVEGLGLHYRNMLLVTGDIGFQAARTIDVEVWLPGQGRYYEVSSVSNCRDFQARRAQIRFREAGGKPELVHTLNGSGTATARLMVALLENNQQEDGSVVVPEVLRPYLDGVDRLYPA